MKKGLSAILGLCCCLGLIAQNDTTFYNADWDTMPSRDGAAYFRLFEKLEPSLRLYFFTDYYISGEKQATCSYRDPKGIKKSGEWIWYYKNGQISQTGTYVDGRMEGDWYKYFDNGDLKGKFTYTKNEDNVRSSQVAYVELYDEKSREHILVDGEGLYLSYYENGDTNTIGQVTGKLKTGTWKAFRADGELYYVEEHINGTLKKGVSYDKEGKKYTYTEEETMPSFVGGQEALMRYLATIVYPIKAREDDIEGTVYVQFVVDKNGNVTEVTIARSSGHSILDEAAKSHVSKSRKWIPGKQRGQATRVQYVVPIKFQLG